MGEISLEISVAMPVYSKMPKMPIHTAYTAQSSKVNFTALCAAAIMPVSTNSGERNNSAAILMPSKKIQTLFMLNYMPCKNII